MTTPSSTPPSAAATPADLIDWCHGRLQEHERAAAFDPMANSVRRVAYELFEAERQGNLDEAALRSLVKILSDEALLARAADLADKHADQALDDGLIADLLKPFDGLPFDGFAAAMAAVQSGVVFTAHPTFAMSGALRDAVADYADAPDAGAKEAAKARIGALSHRPDPTISLSDEHEAVQAALGRAKGALRQVSRAIYGWAKARYPDQWSELVLAPISLASWVGYDLDGRTDIHWGETFRIRLSEKAIQLRAYADALDAIGLDAKGAGAAAAPIAARLRGACALAEEQATMFGGDLDDPQVVVAAANKLTGADPRRLVSLNETIAALDAVIDDVAKDPAQDPARLELCVLRAEMCNYGLGSARIHLRINAAQVRSALRADLGVDETRDFIDRSMLESAAARAQSASTRRINIASVFLEKMTARRQLMLCAEFLNHIDGDTPIRFLIAECEAPATVMGAIYLAKFYGVADRLDISPLFETPVALERGGRFMERLLDEPAYVDYVRARGRLAVQIGFSDSGRFMGQAAANLSIERLQIMLSRAMAAREIAGVDVLIFNTHGESMGRGAFPGDLQERFDYLLTPWTRARFRHDGLRLISECSFQGGDGFLHFHTDGLAAATVAALLRWTFERPDADKDDRFYQDINYSWDFYRAVKGWQEDLFDDPDYQASIGAFGPNLLVSTGSRKSRRQSGAAITGPRSLRAIPHNAILQQLAAPANVFGGVGAAARGEEERLLAHVRGSARMRQIVDLVRQARAFASLPALRGYGAIYSASFWISKASLGVDPALVGACEEIAAHLKDNVSYSAINRLADHFAADLTRLDRIFAELDGPESARARREARRPLHALHAVRQSRIMKGVMLTAAIPSFSRRHDVSRKTLFDMAFALQFDELAALLETIFPISADGAALLGGIEEPADDLEDYVRGYPEIHRDIIEPLRRIHWDLREIGVGLSHFYKAYG